MMKNLLLVFAAAVLSCSGPEPASELYPNYLIKEEDWIVYEGTLPSSHGPDVHVELSLFPGAPGLNSRYRMTEYAVDGSTGTYDGWVRSVGEYSLFYSADGLIIHIPDRIVIESVSMRGQHPSRNIEKIDLYLKSDGEHKLLVLDEELKQSNADYSLIRRSSPLFTVEGYFSVYNDTTDFFERNTRKKWSVSKLARYNEAVRNYQHLATERFQGVYLKALAYTVRHVNAQGKEIDALVFKEILQMDSTARIR